MMLRGNSHMDFDGFFKDQLDGVREEGRYRVFTDIKRHRGSFPQATRRGASPAN